MKKLLFLCLSFTLLLTLSACLSRDALQETTVSEVSVSESASKSSDEQIAELFSEGQTSQTDTAAALAMQWEEVRAKYPNVVFPEGMDISFAQIYAVNQDVVGWLTIPNGGVSTVLLQADTNDYYLYRDTYKETTKYGTPYVDYRDDMQQTGLSRNTIIYGHNTHDGLKFHNLTQYIDLAHYRAAPLVTLKTLFHGTTDWKIFAVDFADADNEAEFDFLYTDFDSDASFLALVDMLRARSIFDIPVDVVATDKILTLYTCYKENIANGRIMIFARQVRAGEESTVDTAAAILNADCIQPAAYIP